MEIKWVKLTATWFPKKEDAIFARLSSDHCPHGRHDEDTRKLL
jgi:hypothetical protein